MKILFLTRCLHYGGAERQLVALAIGLRHHGHTVTVAVFYADGPLEEELREAGVPLHSLNKSGRWDTLGFIWRLVKLVRREKPDILHGYLSVSNILTVLIGLIHPRVRVAWGVRASNMNLSDYDWLMRFSYRVECWLSRFADLIIVNSHAGLCYAASNGFPRKKMIVIPNGIDTVRFRPDINAGQKLRSEWGVRESELLIGVVARLDPMKDHPTFLKAASLLAEERADVRFVCVGDGPDDYRHELRALGQQLGLTDKIKWAAGRDDMPAVYNALDILVSSSSFGEGFSNVVGEAMACCVPCVVTDVGDSALIVGDNGDIVPPADVEAMKTAISKVAERIRAADYNRESNRQRIVDRFSVIELEARTEAALAGLSQGLSQDLSIA